MPHGYTGLNRKTKGRGLTGCYRRWNGPLPRALHPKTPQDRKVFVNGSPVKASYRPEAGEEILVEEEEPEPAGVEAQPLPLAILFTKMRT